MRLEEDLMERRILVPRAVRTKLLLVLGVVAVAGFAATGALGGSGAGTITTIAGTSALGAGPSGAAAPGTSAASVRCSKAAATPIVKRLHLGAADFLPDPVGQVFCGAFMGAGSQTMV